LHIALDLLFLIQNEPLLIECKTGQISNSDLDRFRQHKATLSISKQRAFFITLDKPESEADNWSQSRDITVVNRNNFLAQIGKLITEEENPTTRKASQVTPR
jgi:hypothetical protein